LDVYKLTEALADMVWHDFVKWNKKVQNTVGYQIIRSSDSIAANIAEGYGRYTPADGKKFYLYSRGSLGETISWLQKLIRRKVLSESNATEYKAIVEKLGFGEHPAFDIWMLIVSVYLTFPHVSIHLQPIHT
jgi:four helix bundle protein